MLTPSQAATQSLPASSPLTDGGPRGGLDVGLTAELKRAAVAAGFALAGICPAAAPPGLDRFHDWLSAGYAGEILACRVSVVRDGVSQRQSGRTWQHDASLGANTLTIAAGHIIPSRFSRACGAWYC